MTLMTPLEVDRLFRWPKGRAKRLARKGVLKCVTLPDGEIRFRRKDIEPMMVVEAIINPEKYTKEDSNHDPAD